MLSVNTCLFLKDHVYIHVTKGCSVFGTQWTRHWWCCKAITKDCEPLQPIFGEQPWIMWACLPPSLTRSRCDAPMSLLMAVRSTGIAEALHTSCISQKVLFQWPQTAEIKLPVSGPHCAVQLHLFSSGAWRTGLFATSSLSWEVVTHPSQQPLPGAIHHRVSSKPSLVPFHGSQSKERDIQGREEQVTCLGVILSKVLFSGCMAPGEDQPHTRCEGAGVAQHQAQCTDRSLQPIVPSLGATGPCQVEEISYIKSAI